MHLNRKAVYALLIIVPLLTFGHSLGNGFVGDDIVKLVNSDYYSSPENIKTIFSKEYLVTFEQYKKSQITYSGSGEITYRPIVSITYFIDRIFWKLDSFGYHLTNLLLHILNVIMVFLCLQAITKNTEVSLLTALLFAVHPLQAEVVNGISFRHGLLAALFSLLTIIFYVSNQKTGKLLPLILSLLSFAIALFSKEEAVPVIFLLAIYDQFLSTTSKVQWKKLSAFLCILAFYAYAYCVLFPSKMLGGMNWTSSNLSEHLMLIFKASDYYLTSLLFPFLVKLLPLDFQPKSEEWSLAMLWQGIVFILVCISPFYFKQKNKILLFGSLWFVVNLLPVTNIYPLVNPIAHRRMYFPSIGIFLIISFYLQTLPQDLPRLNLNKVFRIAKILLIGTYMIYSSALTTFWKNNTAYANELIARYPWNQKAYYVLGEENFREGIVHFNQNDCKNAVTFLSNAQKLGVNDERIQKMINTCQEKAFP